MIKKNYLQDTRGQALVEMALVLPLLLLLLMGIFEFGRIMGARLILSDLARDGARHAVVGYSDADIIQLVKDRRAWLEEARIEVQMQPQQANRSKGEPLQVSVDYSLPLLTPFLSSFLPDPFPLSATCTMRME